MRDETLVSLDENRVSREGGNLLMSGTVMENKKYNKLQNVLEKRKRKKKETLHNNADFDKAMQVIHKSFTRSL